MGFPGRRTRRAADNQPPETPVSTDQSADLVDPPANLAATSSTPEAPPGLLSTALTAAVTSVSLDGAAWKNYKFGDRAWQSDAWRLYDITGPLRFVANWIGSSVANCRLYVAEVNPDGDAGREVDDDEQIAALAAGPLGIGASKAEALRLLGIDLFVPGEAYIVAESGGGSAGEDLWWVVTGGEIKRQGDRITITRPPHLGGGSFEYRDGTDLLIRCWTPHPRRTSEPDSPTRSAIPDLREIEALRKREFAELDSRLAGAGLLALPDGLDLPRGQDDPPGYAGFQALLQRAMAASLRDRSTAEAMVPIMISGQADLLEKIRHITFWSELSEQIIPLRKEAVESLARSLDIPPEVLMGLGSTNHWAAWAVSDEAINTQIKPVLLRIAAALTLGYLAPALEELGYDPGAYTYAFDWSELTVRPNRSADATTAHDRMLLSDEAVRSAGSWSEEDAPDDDERARRLAEKILIAAPQIALADPGIRELVGLPALTDTATTGQPGEQQPGQPGELPPGPQPEENGPPANQPDRTGQPEGEQQHATIALSAVARYAVRDALKLAGQRLVPHRDRDRYTNVPRHQLHTRYGPVPAARVSGLLLGAWASLDAGVVDCLGIDPGAFAELLSEYAATLLTRGIAHDDQMLADLLASPDVLRRLRQTTAVAA